MSDAKLRELLREGEHMMEREDAGTQLDEVSEARIASAARRRRGGRTFLVAAASVAGIGLVVGAGWLLLGGGDSTPIAPPSGEPTMRGLPAFGGEVTEHETLPTAQAITAQAWSDAGAGWVLASYRASWSEEDPDSGDYLSAYGPQVIYLVSPAGDRYQLTEVEDNATVFVEQWTPGDTTALVLKVSDEFDAPNEWATLELTTGVLSASPVTVTTDVMALGVMSDGTQVWSADYALSGPAWSLTVDGAAPVDVTRWRAAVTVAEAAYNRPEEPDLCQFSSTWDAESDLVECYPPSEGRSGPAATTFYRVYTDGRSEDVTPAQDGDLWASGGDNVVTGGHLVVSVKPVDAETCDVGLAVVEDGTMTHLPGLDARQRLDDEGAVWLIGAAGQSVYSAVSPGCGGDGSPRNLVRNDVVSGEQVELIPVPAGPMPSGVELWGTLTNAYVVPGGM